MKTGALAARKTGALAARKTGALATTVLAACAAIGEDVPERDLPSGYGHSWATIAELRAVEDWPDSCGEQLRCAFLDWVRDEASAAGRLAARHGADNVRVVFGFE